MQTAPKRRREDASPFEEASPPGHSRELIENLEASAAYRLERALSTIDAQASEIERLQGELGRLRHLEGQRAVLAADLDSGAASSVENSILVADLQAEARKLHTQLEASQSQARAQAQRAADAERRQQQLLREYEGVEADRLRLASQLKEAVDDLQRSSSLAEPGNLASESSLKRQNEELRGRLALAESSLSDAKRLHANELTTAQSRTEARQARIEELQQNLDNANASLVALRKESRQTDELEAQLLRARCDLREQQRLAENAEVVRSLQSALHAHSADVAAARRLKQKSDNAEALNEEIATLRTKLARADKAAENATRQQVEHEARASELERWRAVGSGLLTGLEQEAGQMSESISPEAVQSRIQALHKENVRLASEQTGLASRQTTAAATEKRLQAEVVALRKQAMQLNRDLSKAEQKATQLHRDVEFERYQKKALQQLVDSFASAPADAPEMADDESTADGQEDPGNTAAAEEKQTKDAAALAEAQVSLKTCESRIAELEERLAELETANVALTEQTAKLATAESEATEQASRAAEAAQAASTAESALNSVRDELRQAKLAAEEWQSEKRSFASYRATAESEREQAASEKRELLAQNARLIEQVAASTAP